MREQTLPLNQIIHGDCVEVMNRLPAGSADLIFADPPYNLQLSKDLWRPNMTRVEAVRDQWDQFKDFEAYDRFTRNWLTACRRVLKDTGTLWTIGTYHNIFRIGVALQDLGFWILNDIIWVKTNPMPNFRGVRFTNAHETLIWASKRKGARYTLNYHAMKRLNEGKQMRSDWLLPVCSGSERVRVGGAKAHSTQKPEALLYRVLLSSSNPGHIVLDPFFGTGTTGVVAKKLHRHWIGVEREEKYIEIARRRIDRTARELFEPNIFDVRDKQRLAPRVSFSRLVEQGYFRPGEALYFQGDRDLTAKVRPDGRLRYESIEGSIHQVARHILGGRPCNGWQHWYFETDEGELRAVDERRKAYRARQERKAE